MPYAGKTIMPRDIGYSAYRLTDWRNFELTKAIGTALGESKGSLGAWHDNLDAANNVVSRDCGLFQINIPASQIGTGQEMALRSESLDPAIYETVRDYNTTRALELYNHPWTRNGQPDIRRWEPWVAYTSGWVPFPEWWVWHQDANDKPIGPWVETGRYIHRAIVGQMNLHVVILKDWTVDQGLFYGQRYIDHFGIKGGKIGNKNGAVAWVTTPPQPASPPSDGVGPRPVENDGV
jgi:hypothetical protein